MGFGWFWLLPLCTPPGFSTSSRATASTKGQTQPRISIHHSHLLAPLQVQEVLRVAMTLVSQLLPLQLVSSFWASFSPAPVSDPKTSPASFPFGDFSPRSFPGAFASSGGRSASQRFSCVRDGLKFHAAPSHSPRTLPHLQVQLLAPRC